MSQQQFSYTQTKRDKAMTNEQFEQIVEAILAGKYSWACVLILRFAGYNPLHYIPYRTYNRLIKDNCLRGKSNREQQQTWDRGQGTSAVKLSHSFPKERATQINDLSYLGEVEQKGAGIRGGWDLFFTLTLPFI